MSTFTPSNDDIMTPGSETPREKSKSRLGDHHRTGGCFLLLLPLHRGYCQLWFIRFGLSFLSGLFGGF